MFGLEAVLAVSILYFALIFAVCRFADRRALAGRSLADNPYVYTLSLAVLASAWTYYGSIGLATERGLGYLPFHLGQTLVAILFPTVLFKIIRISKTYRLTSFADFAAARYGNSGMLGAAVATLALVGMLPYLALQLKAIADSALVLSSHPQIVAPPNPETVPVWRDIALYATFTLALFTIIFGTRHRDTAERHEGLVVAAALDAIIKLVAFIAVGVFVVYGLFDGIDDIFQRATQHPDFIQLTSLGRPGGYTTWGSMLMTSIATIMFLPRQFQISVVENVRTEHLRTATWLFPLYFLVINIFVLPIALSGLLRAPAEARGDIFILLLPLLEGANGLAWLVFIGGLSTVMLVVAFETVALSTMITNNLVLPAWIRWRGARNKTDARTPNIMVLRRASVAMLLILVYVYYRGAGDGSSLVSLGVISFVAGLQLAPAILGGLYWRRATRLGALSGVCLGFAVWFYTLLLPSFVTTGWIDRSFIDTGLRGINILRPHALFGVTGLDPVAHSVIWSMLSNIGAFLIISLLTEPTANERLQARRFVDAIEDRTNTTAPAPTGDIADVHRLLTRFLGVEGADDALAAYAIQRFGHNRIDALVVDPDLMQFVESLLAGAIGVASAQTALVATIRHDPTRDSLTGLPNLAHFNNRVTAALARANQDPGHRFAVACINLDRFRTITNSLGYHAGEQLLVGVSERLEQHRRPDDVLARAGGDEFALLQENVTGGADAVERIESLCRVLIPPFHINGNDVFISGSAGVAMSDSIGHDRAETIFRDAETAMLRAKQRGNGRIELFEPTMHERATELFQMETDLRRAIRRGELEIHYQPIVTLPKRQLWGFEALVRWRHPKRGLLLASEFLPLSEETGLILPIGNWLLHGACRQMREWHTRFPSDTPLQLSVNLSVKQFAQSGLIGHIAQSLEETRLDPRTLKLEITESALIENFELARTLLNQLHAMQIHLSMDDFGTGYSSLSYLHRFPIDMLKIDRSFITQITSETRQTQIVAATITLAHNLGIPVVVEGVESQQQADYVTSLSADFGQGYYFSVPLSSAAAESFIHAHAN